MSDKNGYDPYDDAMTDEADGHYGQIHIEAFQGFFVKGQKGATPYDENAHGPDQKHYLIIEFVFTPIDPKRQIFTISTVKWAAEYNQCLRPSVESLADQIAKLKSLTAGQFNPLRELAGLYVRTERVPRPGNKEGETWTTHRFLEIYPDEAACRKAYEEASGEVASDEIPFTPDEVAAAAANDPQRAAFAIFLPPLWAKAKEGESDAALQVLRMAALLASDPVLKTHFNINSPEVKEAMKA